VNIKNRYNVNA